MKVARIPQMGPKSVAHTDFCVYTDENFAITGIRLYFLSFFAEAWQKGFVSKEYSQVTNFPFFNGCVYYKKTAVCLSIIYRTYVESTLSIIICRYRIRDFAWRANFLHAHALKWTVSRWPHYFNARANQESLWKFKNRSRTHYVHEKSLK